MWKRIYRMMLLILLLCGIGQFFLLPGLIWQYCFPLVPLVVLFISFVSFKSTFKKNSFIRNGSIFLVVLFLFECGFNLYSYMQVCSNKVETEIKILSYNVFFKNKSKNQTVLQIKQANPDILLIQEFTPQWEKVLTKQLGKVYPHKSVKSLNGTNGLAIYSKFQIDKTSFLTYPNGVPYTQIVDLLVKDKRIQLINAHLASPAIAVENSDRFLSYYMKNYKTRKNQIKSLNQIGKNGVGYSLSLIHI